MVGRLFGTPAPWTVVWPLIQEARDRQRRRRVALAQVAALAAVFGLATMAAGRGGGPAAPVAHETASASVQAEIRDVISEFDAALAAGDYARACSLLDPWMGMVTVRTATTAAGVRGSCEQRLAGVARIVGPTLVDDLHRASVSQVQVGGSESGSFTAAAVMDMQDEVVRGNTWAPVVAVARNAPHARVLVTCPPLLCASGFLAVLQARNRSGRS
jgi:hypothetical protein